MDAFRVVGTLDSHTDSQRSLFGAWALSLCGGNKGEDESADGAASVDRQAGKEQVRSPPDSIVWPDVV